jgi:hypothetical protein
VKQKYRVTLPISLESLENGAVQIPGTILELDLDTAKGYAHALIAVQEEKHAGNGD